MKRFVRLSIVIATFACGCADATPPAEMARDPLISEDRGVRTVVNHEPRWRAGEAWTVSEQPMLRIGRVDGPSEYLFDRIRGLARLSNGVIVVLNSGDGQLRYYAADGTHLRSVGRTGHGPGEMRDGRWLDRLPNDVVQVTHLHGRLRYGPEGIRVADDRLNLRRLHVLSRIASPAGSAGFLMESCAFPAPLFVGDVVVLCASTNTDARYLPKEPGLHQSISLVARSNWALDAIDTVGIFANRSLIMYEQGRRVAPVYLDPPFGPAGRMRVSGMAPHLVFTPADAYRIEVYGLDPPGPRLVVERVGGLRQPDEAELGSFERAFARRRAPVNPAAFRGLVKQADSLSVIADAPHIDAQGALWVPLVAPDRAVDIFAADGIYQGAVVLPAKTLRIYEIGRDYILGVEQGDFDEEYGVVYRLDRRINRR